MRAQKPSRDETEVSGPSTSIHVEPLTGAALSAALPALAKLRITVFRDFPYLYDGTVDYEQAYLAKFASGPGAVCVAAFDGDQIVGASTGAPMAEHAPEFGAPFAAKGWDVARLFYCSESVLLKSHRGHGLGHAFFDHREAHARKLGGFTHSTFSSVIRPADHPLRPANYQPLDGFWTKRGYAKADGIVGSYTWKDIDQPTETSKAMQFWIKQLEITRP
jgi:GNAT superfamily N-acetyltransferase